MLKKVSNSIHVTTTHLSNSHFIVTMKLHLALVIIVLLNACIPQTQSHLPNTTDQLIYCNKQSDCPSGICNPLKADYGTCVPEPCASGEQSRTNEYFCNASSQWQQSKQVGEHCENEFECYKPTCFMNPTCELSDIPYTIVSCTNNICTSKVTSDCPPGSRRILEKDQYWTNGTSCFESIAQMVLPTICAPCGNGICDNATESVCNCPQDCGENYGGLSD